MSVSRRMVAHTLGHNALELRLGLAYFAELERLLHMW